MSYALSDDGHGFCRFCPRDVSGSLLSLWGGGGVLIFVTPFKRTIMRKQRTAPVLKPIKNKAFLE